MKSTKSPSRRFANITVFDIALVGILSALVVIGTMLRIPLGKEASVHLGSAVIYIAALVFGGVPACLAGAMGSAAFDIMFGLGAYTPWSIVIKGTAGLVAGLLSPRLDGDGGRLSKAHFLRQLIALLVSAVIIMGGYLLAWTVNLGSFASALGNLPATLLTSGLGILPAMLLSGPIQYALSRAGYTAKKHREELK